ncbi:MAG: ABC transporter substrate-binding protein [Treponema sp.]|nr:ABC transporter substrate-binding protein [Treponema sp.]
MRNFISVVVFVGMLGFSACRDARDIDAAPEDMMAAIAALKERFPEEMPRGEGIGGVLNVGLVSNSGFAGVFNPAFSITAQDGSINDFMFSDLLNLNPGNMYGHNGPAWYEYDHESIPATFTLHFHDDVEMYWHDGEPVTMYDLEYAFLLIAHPDCISERFGPALNTSTVIGVEAYRARQTDRISGIRVFNDGRSIEFSFESMDPSMLFGGIWSQPLPRHRLSSIPYGQVLHHEYSRSDIIGNGPFMFNSTIPGESVSLTANPNYWLGRPKLDGVNIAIIDPSLIGEAMRIGTFDIAEFPPVSLPDYEDRLTNVTFVSSLDRLLSFMGFRFGTLNRDEPMTVTPNPDLPTNCIDLRRALAYGRDNATVARHIFNNLRFPLATAIIPWQGGFMREDMTGFSAFNLDKANEILDEAGYEWRNGETFRRHKDTGEFFEIVWAVHENPTNHLVVPHHIRDWRRIGLNVVLYRNGLMEFNDRIETLGHDLDNGAIHMFDAAWLVGSNPNPRGLWGITPHNDTRYQSPRLDAIMDAIESEMAWDQEWLVQQYHDWQLAVFEEAPWIPVMTGIQLYAVNNRVLNYSLVRNDGIREIGNGAVHLWALRSASPDTAN